MKIFIIREKYFLDNDVIMNDLKCRKLHFFLIFFWLFGKKT